jgi:hypothetical protein
MRRNGIKGSKQETRGEMKTPNHEIRIPAALVITVALMALSLATSSRVIAQVGTQQFKVGDQPCTMARETNSSLSETLLKDC